MTKRFLPEDLAIFFIFFVILVLLIVLPSTTLFLFIKIFLALGLAYFYLNPGILTQWFSGKSETMATENTGQAETTEKKDSKSFDVDTEFENYTQNLLTSLKSVTGAESVLIFFYNEFKHHFKLAKFISTYPQKMVSEKYFKSDEGIFKLLVDNPHPMIEKEIEISPKFLPYYKEKISSSGTLVLFPFHYLGKFFGVICLDHPDAHAISQEKIVKAEKLVRNYEIFFNFSSQLFEYQLKHKLEKSYAEIANKFNISLSSDELWDVAHEFLANYFKFDRAFLILTDSPTPVEESKIIIHRIFGTGSGFSEGDEYLLNDGVVAWCILQKQSIKFNDVYKRNKKLYRFTPDEPNHLATRSIVISPLVSGNFTYGAIILESQFPYQYGETEKELLNFLSQQLSHALRRIMLFEKMAMYQAKDPELEVWNSKAFKERLEEEILRSQRFQHPFSVILFNVRFAAGTNDFMDMDQKKILKEIIKIIKSESRKIDWIGTIQGNDISILLLETDQKGAKIYIQRILHHLQQASKTEIFANIRITISVSYSSFPVMAKSSEEIFAQLKQTAQLDGSQNLVLELNE